MDAQDIFALLSFIKTLNKARPFICRGRRPRRPEVRDRLTFMKIIGSMWASTSTKVNKNSAYKNRYIKLKRKGTAYNTMEKKKTISILGSTGSIGTQALDVCKKHGFKVKALAAGSNWEMLAKQCIETGAETACIYNAEYAGNLENALSGRDVKILTGMDGLCEIASGDIDILLNSVVGMIGLLPTLTAIENGNDIALANKETLVAGGNLVMKRAAEKGDIDILLNSVVGMIGLLPTLTAIENGNDIALANKETLVAGGNLVMKRAAEKGVSIYPVDSEHSAIFQCLQGNRREQLKKIILTASGGPFFGKKLSELSDVTIEQALNHPNWSMGSKITIDSSTLMNKGLEFIEAKWLFDLEPEQIEIVVHRQSVVHSAVEYADNSVIAQMGVPDMKIPIQYAILYPERFECDCRPLSLTDYGTLTFEKPDYETFRCLTACIEAIKRGGAYPCIVNGANEEAVKHFLAGEISFTAIGDLVSGALEEFPYSDIENYEDVIKWDEKAREYVRNKI